MELRENLENCWNLEIVWLCNFFLLGNSGTIGGNHYNFW